MQDVYNLYFPELTKAITTGTIGKGSSDDDILQFQEHDGKIKSFYLICQMSNNKQVTQGSI